MKEHLKELKTIMNRWDFILIIIVLLCALIFLFAFHSKEDNDTVQVYINNQLFHEYDLHKNQIIQISEHNSIEIFNSKVRMLKSSCKNQQCVKQGWTEHEPIICIPNKIAIKMKKKTKKPIKMLISY